jgi:hypothetical protein
MSGVAPEEFDKPYLLLCEGVGDKLFFDRLIENRNIERCFSTHYPARHGHGRSAFGSFLLSASINESFISTVKAILIVSDNDDNQVKSFTEVQEEVKKTELPVPQAVQLVATSKEYPRVVVLMIPIGDVGNLESLCLQSAHSKWGLETELDQFMQSTPAARWALGKQAKMKMQTILAATNSQQPDTGFAAHWKQPETFRVPLSHACFDGIAIFLQGFPALVSDPP